MSSGGLERGLVALKLHEAGLPGERTLSGNSRSSTIFSAQNVSLQCSSTFCCSEIKFVSGNVYPAAVHWWRLSSGF